MIGAVADLGQLHVLVEVVIVEGEISSGESAAATIIRVGRVVQNVLTTRVELGH